MTQNTPTAPFITFAFAKRNGVVVTGVTSAGYDIAYLNSTPLTALCELQRSLGAELNLTQMAPAVFNRLLGKTYESDAQSAMLLAEEFSDELNLAELVNQLPTSEDLLDMQDDAPVIRLLNALLSEAIKRNASDIHVETFAERLLVRFRIDGILHAVLEPQRLLAPVIISRIKVMAKLDIAEKRIPQDGRIALRLGGRLVDVRVSTMPTSHGERVVLRLLDQENAQLNLATLGMPPRMLEHMTQLIQSPHGIILVTGPTGSGKTTTLYAALTALNETTRNILTIEDPVEYYLEGIGQTQVNPKIDMTFAKGLRAILRQDPDVVMVGEIRDAETAEIAVQASLTGHLVLSTLHTNSAIGAITRLHDMGVEPFLLASSLIGVVAQRLVRLLCPHCKVAKVATPSECQLFQHDLSDAPLIYKAVGCTHCSFTGYHKRTGIYDIIVIDDALRTMIHRQAGEHELKTYCRDEFPSLRQDGLRRVLAGDTSLEEILRITSGH